MNVLRIVIAAAVLAVGIFVALSPATVYAPVPRVVLFMLVASLPAVLFGAEAVSKFELKLPGFIFTAGGATAVVFGGMVLMAHLAKPEQQIAVYYVVDESGQPVDLQWKGALEVQLSDTALQATALPSGNAMVLIFPEQIAEATVRVRKASTGPVYSGTVTYAGTRTRTLTLGKELKSGG